MAVLEAKKRREGGQADPEAMKNIGGYMTAANMKFSDDVVGIKGLSEDQKYQTKEL